MSFGVILSITSRMHIAIADHDFFGGGFIELPHADFSTLERDAIIAHREADPDDFDVIAALGIDAIGIRGVLGIFEIKIVESQML